MGLIVIIILLAIGMLFTVNYMIKKKPSETKKSFTESQMAANIMSAILKTSTPLDSNDPLYCSKMDFTELLQECAGFNMIRCNNGMDSCEYANHSITKMLNSTLAKWKKPYRFRAWRVPKGTERDKVDIINLDCTELNIGPEKDYQQRQTKLSPVPLNPGTLMIQFDICS